MTLNPVKLRRGNIHTCRIHGGFAVHQVQVPAIKEHQVVIEFFCQYRPELKGFFVKRDIFLRSLIGTHDGRVTARASKTDVAFFHYGHVTHAVVTRQKIGRGEAMQATPDDDSVII